MKSGRRGGRGGRRREERREERRREEGGGRRGRRREERRMEEGGGSLFSPLARSPSLFFVVCFFPFAALLVYTLRTVKRKNLLLERKKQNLDYKMERCPKRAEGTKGPEEQRGSEKNREKSSLSPSPPPFSSAPTARART